MADDNPPPPRLLNLPTATAILHRTTAVISTRHHLPTLLILSFSLFLLRITFNSFTHSLTAYIDNDPFIQSQFKPAQLSPKPASATHRHRLRSFGDLKDDPSFVLDSFDPNMGFSRTVNKTSLVGSDTGLNRFDSEWAEWDKWFRVLYVIGVFTASFLLMFVAYHAVLVSVQGVVFVMVVNGFLEIRPSYFKMFRDGAFLGARRLWGLVIMRWATREGLAVYLGSYYFGQLAIEEDWYSLLKIFVRMEFMTLSIVPPWIKGFDREIYGFLISWTLLDAFVSYAYTLCAWVAMEDPTRTVKEVRDEGNRLSLLRIDPGNNLMYCEGVVCGLFGRIIFTHLFGRVFASVFQSLMEVYFLVAWLMHYFSVKSLDAERRGISFGNAELEAMIQHD